MSTTDLCDRLSALSRSLDRLGLAMAEEPAEATEGFPARIAAEAEELLGLCERIAEAGLLPVTRLVAEAHAAASCLDLTSDRRAAAAYSRRVLDLHRRLMPPDASGPLSTWAGAVEDHLRRLGRAGGRDEALALSASLLYDYERLGGVPLDELIDAWSRHARMLARGGEHQGALEAALRIVELRETAHAERPDHGGLAKALSNAIDRLGPAGRHDEAVTFALRGVELAEEAIASGEAPTLARAAALDKLVTRLLLAGRDDEAVDATRRETAAWTEVLPETDERNLTGVKARFANALTNRAIALHRVGRDEESLDSGARAVAVLEEIVGERPGLRPDLANAHFVRLLALRDLHRRSEAVTAGRRAVEIYAALKAEDPDREGLERGEAYEALAVLLADAGSEEALEHSEPARAEFTAADPAEAARVAMARESRAHTLRLAGRWREAADVTDAAMRAWHAAAEHDPEEWAETAAAAAARQAGFHDRIGDRVRSAAFAAEALDRTRRLVDEGRDGLRVKLAERGNDLAMRRVFAGDRLTAVEAASRATAIARVLAAEDRDEHLWLLHDSLSMLAWTFHNAARPEDALTAGAETLALAEELDEPDGDHYALGGALDSQAAYLAAAGRPDEALALSDRALALWRERGENTDLAWCLWHRAIWLTEVGAGPVLPLSEHAVAILRAGDADDPYVREDLSEALSAHARHLHAEGRVEEAHAAVAESIAIREALAEGLPARHRPALADALLIAARLGAGDVPALAERAAGLLREADAREPGVFTARLTEAEKTLAG